MRDDIAMYTNKELDEKYRYDGKDLGVHCTETETVFKVWSPLAKKLELRLYREGDGKVWLNKEMQPAENGVWQLAFPESLHGMYYDYLIWRDGEAVETADPYATGCNCNGDRSMVVNLRLTDPPGFEADVSPKRGEEQIVYELHIKDFSYDKDSGVKEAYRGKYLAFTVPGTNGEYPTCMEYLKNLGVTHVHLLPFFDYG